MDEQEFEELAKLRKQVINDGYMKISHVFVPVGPAQNEASHSDLPRILYVGKATRDYSQDRVSTYERSWTRNKEIASEMTTPFWYFGRHICNAVRGFNEWKDARNDQIMGWSNLAKIGRIMGNPCRSVLNFQAELCQKLLKREIERMTPDAVVVVTGKYGCDEIITPVFGNNDWLHAEGPVHYKWCNKLNTALLHTGRPQGMLGSKNIAEKMGRFVTSVSRMRSSLERAEARWET